MSKKTAPYCRFTAVLTASDRTGERRFELGHYDAKDEADRQGLASQIRIRGAELENPAKFPESSGKPLEQTITLTIHQHFRDFRPKTNVEVWHRGHDAFTVEKAFWLAEAKALGFKK